MSADRLLQIQPSSDCEIVFTREFDAPRALVFAAHTQPELLRQWLVGPPGWTLEVCQVDLRPGGAYRYVWRGSDGSEMGMGGVHREVSPPERIVATQLFDQDWTGGETLGTLVLADNAGVTRLTNTVRYSSTSARDAVLASPMAEGMRHSFGKLDELLVSLSGWNQGRISL